MQKTILIRWYDDDTFLRREIDSYLYKGYKFIDFIVIDRLNCVGILIVE